MLATQCDTYDGNLRDLSLQMLRPLGGSIGVNYYRRDSLASGIQEIQTVFVSCPLRSWAAVFGEPQQVHLHFDLPTAQWECSWEQHLPNGLVRCVGYIFRTIPRRQLDHREAVQHLSARFCWGGAWRVQVRVSSAFPSLAAFPFLGRTIMIPPIRWLRRSCRTSSLRKLSAAKTRRAVRLGYRVCSLEPLESRAALVGGKSLRPRARHRHAGGFH